MPFIHWPMPDMYNNDVMGGIEMTKAEQMILYPGKSTNKNQISKLDNIRNAANVLGLQILESKNGKSVAIYLDDKPLFIVDI